MMYPVADAPLGSVLAVQLSVTVRPVTELDGRLPAASVNADAFPIPLAITPQDANAAVTGDEIQTARRRTGSRWRGLFVIL